jgi:hypothetical protein
VARFTVRRIPFGRIAGNESEDDDGCDLPRPHLLRLQARRAAGIAEAAETLAVLPGPGESLHAIMTARLDMTDVLNSLLEKLGRCDRALIATLGYNRRNFRAILNWLDSGKVGSLDLVASIFFRSHNGDLWTETVKEFRRRSQRAACCPSHCKVMALHFADGTRFAIEGSANLCSNGSARENFAIVNDPALHDFHARWIGELVTRHEGEAPPSPRASHYRHAGLGVWCARRGLADDLDAFHAWKAAPSQNERFCRDMATSIVMVIRQWQASIPSSWIVTTPPPGASEGTEYPAGFLGRAVAGLLNLDYMTTLQRGDGKKYRGRHYALQQSPFIVTCRPADVALVVDDLMTSGTTMKLSLDALKAAGVPAFGFAYSGND